jgi:anthranilate/para-aminobenzoate synthase component I
VTIGRATADLVGDGWGPWRGRWWGDSILTAEGGTWVLRRDDHEVGRWDTFTAALQDLWTRRGENRGPWGIGYLGYEACAALGGDLPARAPDDTAPTGWWLVEPRFDGEAPGPASAGAPRPVVAVSLDAAAYRDAVEAVRARIAAGDVYQVNLTRRFELAPGTGDLLAAAVAGGTPEYAARLAWNDAEVVCASMELLLRRRGDRLETRPIKGTRPRAQDPATDRCLAAELDADPKEIAELAMIVDLERNDLGRVAVSGSVEVADPGSVVSWPTVHHRVALVTAALRPGVRWWEALAAVVPGGSVTGCPKRAAMGVIAALEPVPRGPYCGALGVVTHNGDLELALPIRTAWRRGARWWCAAGCGIVWDSDPEREERESRLKVARWAAGADG